MASVVGMDRATSSVVGADTLSVLHKSYLVQEEDGVSRFTLEDDSGFILLEESSGSGAGVVGNPRPSAWVIG